MVSFACNGCGACCRRVRPVVPNWPTRPDGACIHLTADNRCAIYETRPASMALEAWHKLNAEACAQFQKEDECHST